MRRMRRPAALVLALALLFTAAGAESWRAAEKNIPLCDLKKDSRDLYLNLGEEKTAELFVRLKPGENPDFPDGHDDKTHFNAFGADMICRLLVEELREYPSCAGYLKT